MVDDKVMSEIKRKAGAIAGAAYAAASECTGDNRELIVVFLRTLAAEYRELARMWSDSHRRGWQSTAKELRQCATAIEIIAKDLDNLNSNGIALAYVADSAPNEIPGAAELVASLPDASIESGHLILAGDVATYLSGAVDMLPEQPPVIPDIIVESPEEIAAVQPMFMQPNDMPADPFTDPGPPSWRADTSGRMPPGGRKLSFADLLAPVDPGRLPDHWSWSQLETSEDCGLRYRLQRIEAVEQVPQWVLIGGRAFHAAVEEIEQHETRRAFDTAALWERALHTEIADTTQHSAMPLDQWRASAKGKEGYDWWRVEGGPMLQRYLDNRLSYPIAKLPNQHGQPLPPVVAAVEAPFTLRVPTREGDLRVEGILDQVRNTDAGLVVVDLKSGAHMPDDTFQLGIAAWAIIQRLYGITSFDMPKIFGMFYNARKGTYTDRVDLLERHPWEEILYRFHAAEAKRAAGVYTPRRSSFCGGCSVRYACPVGGR